MQPHKRTKPRRRVRVAGRDTPNKPSSTTTENNREPDAPTPTPRPRPSPGPRPDPTSAPAEKPDDTAEPSEHQLSQPEPTTDAPADTENTDESSAESARGGQLDEEPTPAEPPKRPAAARRWWRRPMVLILAVLVLAAAGLTGYLATRPPAPDTHPSIAKNGDYTPGTLPSDDGAGAVSAAARAVRAALSYDYRSLNKGLANAKAQMSSKYVKQFRATFNKTAKPLATKKHAVTNSLVRGAGLADLPDSEHATCLVYVDQILVSSDTMKNKKQPAKVSQDRVSVEMTRDSNGKWKLNGLRPF